MIDTSKYEEYQNARVEGFIPAEWEFEDYLLAEVKRLQMMEKFYMRQWHDAVRVMKHAVREAINTRQSHKCPTCDELDIWFEDFVTKEDVGEKND